MNEGEFTNWLLFTLIFAVLPIKSAFRAVLKCFGKGKPREIVLCIDEEDYHQRHSSQLYRPGDKKYKKIAQLSDNAKSISQKSQGE